MSLNTILVTVMKKKRRKWTALSNACLLPVLIALAHFRAYSKEGGVICGHY